MRIPESCARCMYDRQSHRVPDEEYLKRVKEIIDNREENDASPYLVYLFNQVQEELFGHAKSYADVKKKYNDLMLGLEDEMRGRIESSDDPLKTSFQFARIGNYIDFGAMNNVDDNELMALFDNTSMSNRDETVYESLISQTGSAKTFLLITDNCGEIVLDKLFIEQLQKAYPGLSVTVLVRGGEVLNDATREDAIYVGIDKIARLIDNGKGIGGTVYSKLSDEAREAVDNSDVILAKGQGNYESLHDEGIHVFCSFLCKCEFFTSRFNVPRLTGILTEIT